MSGFIPREFIQEILARTDIVELIDSRVPLKKAGRNYQACCPFHEEKTPSFNVSPTKQFYHCFGCGASGNALSFLIHYDRVDFIQAVETLAKIVGLEIPRQQSSNNITSEKSTDLYAILHTAKQFYRQQLRQASNAIRYLQQRGISGEIAKQYAIGYAPAAWDGLLTHLQQPASIVVDAGLALIKENGKGYYDRFRERIMFPIHDRRGRVIGFGGRVLGNSLPKYLNSPETSLFHKSQVLYGLYEARLANQTLNQLLVVEGYMDVVALAQAGITFAVATLGTATTSQHVQQLFQQTDHVIFCFDGDRAGQTAAWRALESTLPILRDDTKATFLFLPEGEDPDSLVQKEGQDAFLQRLTKTVSLVDFFFMQLKSCINSKTTEGRAQLVHLALPMIEKMQAPILREMMLDQLANQARIEKPRLYQFTTITMTIDKNQDSQKIQKTPMRLAIALLLQYPYLAEKTTENIDNFTLPGSDVLQQLIQLLQTSPQLSTGQLLEHWRDHRAFTHLQTLAAWEHGVPEEGIVAEWHGILAHLQIQQREQDIENLLQKANQLTLTNHEKNLLQALLAEK